MGGGVTELKKEGTQGNTSEILCQQMPRGYTYFTLSDGQVPAANKLVAHAAGGVPSTFWERGSQKPNVDAGTGAPGLRVPPGGGLLEDASSKAKGSISGRLAGFS